MHNSSMRLVSCLEEQEMWHKITGLPPNYASYKPGIKTDLHSAYKEYVQGCNIRGQYTTQYPELLCVSGVPTSLGGVIYNPWAVWRLADFVAAVYAHVVWG